MVSVVPRGYVCTLWSHKLEPRRSLDSKELFLSGALDWTVLDQSDNEYKKMCLNQVVFAFNTTNDKFISNRPSLWCGGIRK